MESSNKITLLRARFEPETLEYQLYFVDLQSSTLQTELSKGCFHAQPVSCAACT